MLGIRMVCVRQSNLPSDDDGTKVSLALGCEKMIKRRNVVKYPINLHSVGSLKNEELRGHWKGTYFAGLTHPLAGNV